MKPVVGAIACILVLAAGGLALAQPEPASPGQRLIERNCAQCHATGREGDSPDRRAPPLRSLFMRYTPDTLSRALDEGLLAQHRAMPQFRFAPAEVNQIIRYLKAIQEEQSA